MSDFSRRSLVRGVAWTVPVVAVAANAPAFAVSNRCRPTAECKLPGASDDKDEPKTYVVQTNCGGSQQTVVSVFVDGQPTTDLGGGRYETADFGNSANFRSVVIRFADGTTETFNAVPFAPCK